MKVQVANFIFIAVLAGVALPAPAEAQDGGDSEEIGQWEAQKRRNLKIRATRDSARRQDNFTVGLALQPTFLDFSEPYSSEYYYGGSENFFWAPSFGYRRHFARMFGVETGVKFSLANGLLRDCPEIGCDRGFLVTGEGKLLIGPFGRFVIKPTLGYTGGSYIVNQRLFSNTTSTEATQPVRYRLRTFNAGLSGAVFMGSRDSYALSWGIVTGSGTNEYIMAELQLTYAFTAPD